MFIGREQELHILDRKIASDKFEFGLIYGRRRIGKTALLQEVVSKHDAFYYVANEMGAQQNLIQLSQALAQYYNEPFSFDSYESLFQYLGQRSKKEKTVIIIDEFTYLISTNNELLSVFQNAIDRYLIQSKVKLILSGSHVGMVEDAISYKMPLYGRTTFKMKLMPFDYFDAARFYPRLSDEDKIRAYSVFGGIPFYISRIDDSRSLRENVFELILERSAMFEEEADFFLRQEVRSITAYSRILHAIASGATKLSEISAQAGISGTGTTAIYLSTLQTMDIIEKEISFGEKANSRKTIYRIKDPFFRFHYTFIEKNRSRKAVMDPKVFQESMIDPHFDEFVSWEFEHICRQFLLRKHKNTMQEIGRYWYNDAKRKQDIEIDIVMKQSDRLSAYECKWSKSKIDQRIVAELEQKAVSLDIRQLGFFSRIGHQKELNEAYQYYCLKDLFAGQENLAIKV